MVKGVRSSFAVSRRAGIRLSVNDFTSQLSNISLNPFSTKGVSLFQITNTAVITSQTYSTVNPNTCYQWTTSTLSIVLNGEHPIIPSTYNMAKDFVFILVYVDDLLLIGPNMNTINETKCYLNKQFKMKDLRAASFMLGISIVRDRENRVLYISQKSYVLDILKRYKMQECKPVATPMELSMANIYSFVLIQIFFIKFHTLMVILLNQVSKIFI